MQKKSFVALAALVALAVPLAVACAPGEEPSETLRPITSHDESAAAATANVHVDRLGPAPTPRRAKLARRTAQAKPPAGASSDAAIPPKYQAFAAAFESEMNDLAAPGASVALLEHGQITFAHGFGVKGPNSTEPVDARTLFRYGSMNKALTATALLQLVDEGKASLGASVPSLIPDVGLAGPNASHLTLKDVLSQQSELFDFTNFNLDPRLSDFQCPSGPASLNQFVTGSLFESSESFMGPPGSLWLYSNPNYVLAGAALETTTGAYYADAMKKRVFTPLGMTRTFFDPSQALADGDYTDGLSTNPDGSPWDVAPGAYDCVWMRAAGLGFSSVIDYAKFVEFLARGDTNVLSDASRAAMQSPVVQTYTYGKNDSYGYGLEVKGGQRVIPDGFYRSKLVTHNGGIPGFSSEFYFFPETGFGFVAFANTDGAYFYSSYLAALQSFSGLTASPNTPPSLDFDAGTFPGYAGTYEDESGLLGELVITDDHGAFDIKMPALDALGFTYEASMDDVCEYGFFVTIDSVPVAQQSTLLGALFPAGGDIQLNFVQGPNGTFDWIDIDEALGARRSAGR